MTVTEITDADCLVWNSFVESHPHGTVFHLYQWRAIIERAYGLRGLYLAVFEDNRIIAILPTVLFEIPFKHPYAVSLPFCNYAGILAAPGSDRVQVESELLAALGARGVHSIELRQIAEKSDFQASEVTLRLELPAVSGKLWEDFDPKVRNLVRKAERAELSTRWGVDQLEEFYDVYSRNMSRLGTPAHSIRLFEELISKLPEFVNLLTVRKDGRAIAALVLLKFKSQISDPWASSLREFDSLSPNMMLYWEALRHGIENGFTEFDFGRSHVNSGTYRFKTQWGATPVPLNYVSTMTNGQKATSSVSVYRGLTGRAFSFAWRSLPYSVSRLLGPRLRKYIP